MGDKTIVTLPPRVCQRTIMEDAGGSPIFEGWRRALSVPSLSVKRNAVDKRANVLRISR